MKRLAIALVLLQIPSLSFGDLLIRQETQTESQPPSPPHKTLSVTTQRFKGDKSRIDFEVKGLPEGVPTMMANQTTLVDHKSGQTYMLLSSKKAYLVVPAGMLQQAADMMKPKGAPNDPRPILKATGRSDTLNGYAVEEYVAQTDDGMLTYWFAKSLVQYVPILAKGGAPGGDAFAQFPDPASFPGVPIRMIFDQKSGDRRTITTINVVEVDDTPLSDADFEVPKGYKEVKSFADVMRP